MESHLARRRTSRSPGTQASTGDRLEIWVSHPGDLPGAGLWLGENRDPNRSGRAHPRGGGGSQRKQEQRRENPWWRAEDETRESEEDEG